jgi:hypothetical protein
MAEWRYNYELDRSKRSDSQLDYCTPGKSFCYPVKSNLVGSHMGSGEVVNRQDGHCEYRLTQRRISITIVAEEKQKCCIF